MSDDMEFVIKSTGGTSREAFITSSVSGVKPDYINIELPPNEDPYDFAAKLIDLRDKRVADPQGPAGCIDITNTTYGLLDGSEDTDKTFLFFGWVDY